MTAQDWAGYMPTTDTTTDPFVLDAAQAQATRTLITNSALRWDVTERETDGGRIVLERAWPRLSDGQELLWHIAAWMNGHAAYPDDSHRGWAFLDEDNMRAAKIAMTA